MKNSEMKKLTDEQLVQAEVRAERELVQQNLKHRANRLDDSSKLRKTRKDIARLQTLQRQREMAAGLKKGALKANHKVVATEPAQAEAPAEPAASKGFLKGIVDKLAGRE